MAKSPQDPPLAPLGKEAKPGHAPKTGAVQHLAAQSKLVSGLRRYPCCLALCLEQVYAHLSKQLSVPLG
jgi:hypothetical protein